MNWHKNLTTRRSANDPTEMVAGYVAANFRSITQGKCWRRDHGKPRRECPSHFPGLLRPIVMLLFASLTALGVSQALAANPAQRSLEFPRQSSKPSSFVEQFSDSETEISLAHSGMDSFVRIEQNHRLRPKLEKMIENEELLVALRASMDSFKKASKDIFIDPDAVVVDPVIESMPVAKLELNEAYQKLDKSNDKISLTDRSISRLAWDAANMSSLPGLVRLVSLRDSDFDSPVHVRSVAFDHSSPGDRKRNEHAKAVMVPEESSAEIVSD